MPRPTFVLAPVVPTLALLALVACTLSPSPAPTGTAETGAAEAGAAESGAAEAGAAETEMQAHRDASPVLLPVPDDPTVSFTVWFKVGSQNDPPGKEGLAALTGSLIAGGSTTEHSYQEILERLYPLASSYEVRVDKEMTTLTGRTHRDNLEMFFELFSAAWLHPAFTAEDFERLRSAQLNDLEKTLRYASDEELAKAALTSFVFADTPYEHPILGTVDALKAITRDDVAAFYAAHYTRSNAVVGLGGGYPPELVERVTASLAGLGEGSAPDVPAPQPPPISGHEVLLVSKPGADASISFGFPLAVHRGERDFYALWIANSWLGEHRNSASHLYKVLRELRGLNYGDYSYVEAFPDGGRRSMPPTGVSRRQQMFEVWIRTLPNEHAHFALRAAMRELDQLITEGMSEEEFELTRDFLSKYYLHFAETTQDRLGYAVDDRFYGIAGEGHLQRFGEMMQSLTRDEVNAAIKKHLTVKDVKFAVVTGEAEALKQALTSGAPSPMTYPSEKSAEVLAEDKEIAVYPLHVDAGAVRTVAVDEIFQR